MAMYPCLSLPSLSFPSVSGAVCSFDSQYAGLPLKSHTVDIDYTGNAISNCFVVNMADDTNISYFQGLLNGAYGFVDLGSLTWNKGGTAFTTNSLSTLIKKPASNASTIDLIISGLQYRIKSSNADSGVAGSYELIIAQNGQIIYRYPMGDFIDGEAFRSFVSGHYLIYELATPTTPTITETEFNTLLSAFNISGEAFKIPFDTPIYGGSYNCLTGVVTSNKDSGGGDITPTYQQTATAICETNLGENNIFADTGDTTLQYIKLG